jgi:hypothetical protein
MLRPESTANTPSTATAAVSTPCPWCGTSCTGAIRIAHAELDRQSETTIRRRWAA